MQRNSSNEDLKTIQLFDAMDSLIEYDEDLILKKARSLKKQQLSNVKALLYKQLLASLRLLENKNIDIQLHEQLDYSRILYTKGLYLQSLKLLDKIKETARAHNQISLLVQVLFLEKKIESLHITRSLEPRASQLIDETMEVNEKLVRISMLSNLSLALYSRYINYGHARNAQDEKEVTDYFEKHLREDLKNPSGFYEKLYFNQSYCWYAFLKQDFLMYYRYTQRWVNLFEDDQLMKEIETASYIKGKHNLLTAHFTLRNYPGFAKELERFEDFAQSGLANLNENNSIQVFIYLYIARINKHFLEGTFSEGLPLVKEITDKLDEFHIYLDRHRILVFYYKIASLYFGAGDFSKSIDYLNKIINLKVDLRNDLQCYSRLLHLIAHYELGNLELMEYLVKSVFRFMAKMDNMSLVEEEVFKFLRKTFHLPAQKIKPEFVKLLATMKQFEKDRYETRAFVYLDIISWLESKVQEKPIAEIILQKYKAKDRPISD
ncbi:MAG: hypothetical protein ABIY51_10480 [Ferruginibacter sp.]